MFFAKKPAAVRTPPPGMTAADIRVEASICTGEKTIGFYEKGSGKLLCAEYVRDAADIDRYYRAYGLQNPKTVL